MMKMARPDVCCWRSVAIISVIVCSFNVIVLLLGNRHGNHQNKHGRLTDNTSENMASFNNNALGYSNDLKEQVNPGVGKGGGGGLGSNIDNLRNMKNPLWLPLDMSKYFSQKLLLLGKVRPQKCSVVFGIPTVKRSHAYYLIDTLKSLIDNLPTKDWSDAVIVVVVADSDVKFQRKVVSDVKSTFPDAVESGLVQIVRTEKTFYPNMNRLPRLYGDRVSRVQWRSKQCLDYSFMFYYCSKLADYYIQLEDDIITEPSYFSKIKKFLTLKEKLNWSTIEFGARGFIGMTYRTKHLQKLSKFTRFYFWTMPVDWIFRVFNDIFLYGNSKKNIRKPPLFKHVGAWSSLHGQVRKLEDLKQKGRPKPPAIQHAHSSTHGNPPATITTTITNFVRFHGIEKAYFKHGYFWGKTVKNGDQIDIILTKPVMISRIVFRSGSALYPLDSFLDTILYVSDDGSSKCAKWVELGRFKDSSVVDFTRTNKNPVNCVRLTIERTRVDKDGRPRWLIVDSIALL